MNCTKYKFKCNKVFKSLEIQLFEDQMNKLYVMTCSEYSEEVFFKCSNMRITSDRKCKQDILKVILESKIMVQ